MAVSTGRTRLLVCLIPSLIHSMNCTSCASCCRRFWLACCICEILAANLEVTLGGILRLGLHQEPYRHGGLGIGVVVFEVLELHGHAPEAERVVPLLPELPGERLRALDLRGS